MTTASCMGGWCQHRNACHHHTKDDRRVPVERLCERGKERPNGKLHTQAPWWVELRKVTP